ncbi:MAG TPA: hypothetical protein PKI32_00745 [Opitutales bacterium]|nr:hypothetical protein [Opitutales bacterium]
MDLSRQLPSAGIGGELLLRTQGVPARHRLEFDPQSGELRLRPRADAAQATNPDTTYVDQIASDGFA